MQPCDMQVMSGVAGVVSERGSLRCDELSLTRRWRKGEEGSLVCWCVCFLYGEEGIRGIQLKWVWYVGGVSVEFLTPIVFPRWSLQWIQRRALLLTINQLWILVWKWKTGIDKRKPVGLFAAVVRLLQYLAFCQHSSLMEKYIAAFGLRQVHSLCFSYRTRFTTERRGTLLLCSLPVGGLNKTLKYTFTVHILTANDEHKDSDHKSQSQHNLSDKLTDANPKILNPIHYTGCVCACVVRVCIWVWQGLCAA